MFTRHVFCRLKKAFDSTEHWIILDELGIKITYHWQIIGSISCLLVYHCLSSIRYMLIDIINKEDINCNCQLFVKITSQ